MYYLTRMCCLCLIYYDDISYNIFDAAEDNKTYYEKLTTSLPNLVFSKDYGEYLLCTTCCENIESVYEFNHRCVKNLDAYLGYKVKLNSLTNERSALTVRVVDIEETASNSKNCLDPNQGMNREPEVIVHDSDIVIKRTPGNIHVIFEPDDSDEDFSQNCAYLDSGNSVNVKMEHFQDVKTELQVDNDTRAMNMLTDEDILDESGFTDIKIEENDTKALCFNSGADNVLISQGTIIDDNVTQDQLETNSNSSRIGQGCTEMNKQTGESNTTKYDLRHSCEFHNSDIINEESKNVNSLNVTSPANHSRARTDSCSSGVEVLRIHKHSTSEEGGSKQSSSIIAHSLLQPSYVCDVCDMEFKNSRNLVSHKFVHTNQKPHICGICKKGFSQSSHLIAHKRIHTGEKPFICDICKKGFSQSSHLIAHKRIQTGQKPFICDICKKGFSNLSNLVKHKRIHTGQKPYICDICKKGCSDSSALNTHKRIHTGERPYVCGICKKGFSQSSALVRHKRIHTGQKPYVCDICKKRFTESCNLVSHKRIHTGQKPYICDICKKRFSQLSALITHKRVHIVEKPYVCGICKKGFSQSSALITHKRIHTGEKPYVCGICKKGFSQSSNLVVHKRTHHGEQSCV